MPPKLELERLPNRVAEVSGPFFEDLLQALGEEILSIAVVGAALHPDVSGQTEINSVLVLKEAKVSHLHAIAPLGKKHGRKGIVAPFILTSSYIKSSLDVFPVEFLDFRLAHKTVFGPDLLSDLEIQSENLRLQVERELKTFLIRLRQGFVRSAGDVRRLREVLSEATSEIFPEVRAILHLLGASISLSNEKDMAAACKALEIDGGPASRVLFGEEDRKRDGLESLESSFADLYEFVRVLSEKVDAGLG